MFDSGSQLGAPPFSPRAELVLSCSFFEAGKDAQVPDDDGTGEHHEVLGASE
jgi:hypothetical protein